MEFCLPKRENGYVRLSHSVCSRTSALGRNCNGSSVGGELNWLDDASDVPVSGFVITSILRTPRSWRAASGTYCDARICTAIVASAASRIRLLTLPAAEK